MNQTFKEPIAVKSIYDNKKRIVYPSELLWNGKPYKVKKVGLHYSYRNGNTLYHVFAVSTENLSFKLLLDTGNLFWTVEQISDGLPD